MPNSIAYLNLFLLFIPVILIVYDIMPLTIRKYIVFPSIAVMLAFAHSYSIGDSFFSRMFLIVIDIYTIISVIFAVRRRTFRDNAPTKRMGITLYYLAITCTVLMAVSLIGAVVGAVRLSEFITYATLKSIALVFIFYTISRTMVSLVYTFIFGQASSGLRILAQYRELIYKKVAWFISVSAWLIWAILSLKQFSIWKNIYAILSGIFGHSINIGTTSFTLLNIIVFVFVIMLTIWISRVTKIIIEGEIAPRVKMKRGVPGAVTLILRISIITAGFMIAIAVLGVEMDKLAILLGAFGVGIGFGLQNIFNNLVSGIILAFERPIQEGDIIEVGTLLGTVKEIGIRASVIFTFDGAEVIVPNGNLISNELINWTLTNQTRRIEANVGVKYGTDPDRVLAILNSVAGSDTEVLDDPAPLALFSGFGESSLDFRLLFWIDNADRRLITLSRINVQINRALADAGIEIPFPQRDLHVRSVDRDIPIKLDK
jgi:small-conductance mechanosensitive channel